MSFSMLGIAISLANSTYDLLGIIRFCESEHFVQRRIEQSPAGHTLQRGDRGGGAHAH